MYQITFSPSLGAWLIQIQVFGTFWVSIKQNGKTQTFPDFDSASDKVLKLGLDKVYRNYKDSASSHIWSGGYTPPQVIRSQRAA